MIITKAVNRIFWRFGGNGNKKPFPVNQQDIEAYNSIKDFVQKQQAQQFIDQELFAKLYIYLYMKILENDKTTILDKNPRRKIYNLLKKSIPELIEDFRKSLNDSEYYVLMEELGIKGYEKQENGSYSIPKITEKEINKVQAEIADPEKMKVFTREVWDYETVAECLEAEVNQAINNHL